MIKYIAFLRAVNVGGRFVKMEELKKIFLLPGFANISTFIQSGNVIFETKTTDVPALKKKLEAKLLKALGYEVDVFLKTIPELKKVIAQNPFSKNAGEVDVYVSFLSGETTTENIATLEKFRAKDEHIVVKGTAAYLAFPKKTYGKSKLSNSLLEKKLNVRMTTRNITTLTKLAELH